MFRCKKLLYYFFFSMVVFSFSCISMQEKDSRPSAPLQRSFLEVPKNRYLEGTPTTTPASSPRADDTPDNGDEEEENEEQKLKQSDLETFFEQTTRVSTSEPLEQFLGGVSGVLGTLSSAQVFAPLAIMGLLALGVDRNLVPDTWAYPAALALPMIMLITVGGYTAAKYCFTPPMADGVANVHQKVTCRKPSTLESVIYSPVTKGIEMIFWEGLILSLIMNMESRLGPDSPWGNTRVWGILFSVLIIPLVLEAWGRSSNNANQSVFHPFSEKQTAIIEVAKDAEDSIRHEGLTPEIEALGGLLNVKRFSAELVNINDENEEEASHDRQPQERQRQEKQKYIAVFKQMMAVSNKLPPYIRTWRQWNEKLSTWASIAMGSAGLPMYCLTGYFLWDHLLTTCQVPSDISWKASAGAATLSAFLLTPVVFKEFSLIQKECFHLLDWFYKPQSTFGRQDWKKRLLPLLARGGSFVYVLLCLAAYLNEKALRDTIHIENLALRLIPLVPFCAGALWAGPSQVMDGLYNKIGDWFSTGGSINFSCCDKHYRPFSCLDPEGENKYVLDILNRVKEIKEKVQDLNEEYADFLFSQLPFPPLPLTDAADETTKLVKGNQNGAEGSDEEIIELT